MLGHANSLTMNKPLYATINDVKGDDTFFRDLYTRVVTTNPNFDGLGTQGLGKNARLTLDDGPGGKECYVDFCERFPALKGKIALEAQTIEQSSPIDKPENATGPLPEILNFGVSKGIQCFELYPAEWFVAYDTSNSFYADYGATYRNALNNIATRLKCN